MQKKAATLTFRALNYVLAFFCLLIALTAPVAHAEYKIVYRNSIVSSGKTTPSSKTNNDIWHSFRTEFTLDHQASRPEVKEQIAWFMAHRKYLYAAARNARPYMYYIVEQVKKRDLPVEFALLPIIESAFDPFAYSTAGAAGLWQMMPATATDFRLKQNWWYDGRKDVIASTNAALDYLVYLENFFSGNAYLVLYAYHSGQGTVLKAIKRNTELGQSTDFWSLAIGKNAQVYIPKLLALAEMIGHPEKYPLNMPEIPNKPYLTQVDMGSQIDLAKAAKLSGLSLDTLKNLNPGFNRSTTAPDGPYLLTIPIQNEPQLRDGLALLPQSNRVTWQRYDVKSGDTLSKIATKYHTTTALLQEINKLDNTTLQIGDVLFIPSATTKLSAKNIAIPPSFVSNDIVSKSQASADINAAPKPSGSVLEKADTAIATVEKLVTKVYVVKKGDTLNSIAKQLGVRWESLKTFNHLSSDVLSVGQSLQIPPGASAMDKKPVAEKPQTKTVIATGPKKINYTIKAGDSLGKIAEKFSVSVKKIQQWNPALAKNPVLHVGKTLIIYQ